MQKEYDMNILTKNCVQLLSLFLTNPDKSFYMQEIGKILGKKPGVFQRTLNKMVDEGILHSEYRANARYFSANKDYPLYAELKNIVFKTAGVQGSLQDILRPLESVEYAFVYGSFAKQKERDFSDIDLLIIGSPDEQALIEQLERLEAKLKREINYNIYSLKSVKENIKKKNPFLLNVLHGKKIMLIGQENELRKLHTK